MDKLCAEQGFCLPRATIEKIENGPPLTVDELTDAIFIAEGLDPLMSDRALWKGVREVVNAWYATP